MAGLYILFPACVAVNNTVPVVPLSVIKLLLKLAGPLIILTFTGNKLEAIGGVIVNGSALGTLSVILENWYII